MIIFLYGENDFLIKRKLEEIIDNYKKKHKSGLSFFSFSKDGFDFALFKDSASLKSMFDEKKCIILSGVFSSDKYREKVISYIKDNSIKEDDAVVLIFVEGKLKKDEDFKYLCTSPGISMEFNYLNKLDMVKWVNQEVLKNKATITKEVALQLIDSCKADMRKIHNEIVKLSSYDKNIKKEHLDLFIAKNSESDIFMGVDALISKNKKLAVSIFYKQIDSGKTISYLLAMIASQFRNLIKIREFLDEGDSKKDIIKKTKLHPFVVEKSINKINKYSMNDLCDIYKKIEKADKKIKTTQIDAKIILDNLILTI